MKEIMSFIDRRRDAFGGARPMDIDSHKTDGTEPYTTWWGGVDYSGWKCVPWTHEEEE